MRLASVALVVGILVFQASYGACALSQETPSINERIKGLFEEGLQRQQEKRYPEAIMVYRRALKLDANRPEILNNLGFCYEAMKNYKKAVDYYKQALALKPDLAEAHEYLGEAYLQMGWLDLATQESKTLAKLNAKQAKELDEKIAAYVASGARPSAR